MLHVTSVVKLITELRAETDHMRAPRAYHNNCIFHVFVFKLQFWPHREQNTNNTHVLAVLSSVANLATLSLDLATFQTPLATILQKSA